MDMNSEEKKKRSAEVSPEMLRDITEERGDRIEEDALIISELEKERLIDEVQEEAGPLVEEETVWLEDGTAFPANEVRAGDLRELEGLWKKNVFQVVEYAPEGARVISSRLVRRTKGG